MELQGVILAAGKGARMYPFSTHYPKPLLPVANKPIIQYQVELMCQLGIKDIYIVIGHLGHEIVRKIGTGEEFGVKIHYIEQQETLGIAHAIGKMEKYLDRPFLLFLGDIFFITNSLNAMYRMLKEEGLNAVLATKIEDDDDRIKLNFSVQLDEDNFVKRVIEKPRYLSNKLKGCGIYLFDLQIFDAIRSTPRTAMRDEYEITNSIQILIELGGKVKSANVIEEDLNLTFPYDLHRLNMAEIERRKVVNIIDDSATIHDNAQLTNCVIGRKAQILHPIKLSNCVVFDNVIVKNTYDISHFILTDKKNIDHRSGILNGQ